MTASGTVYDLLASESLVRWDAGSPVGSPETLSYSFPTTQPSSANYPGFTAFSNAEIAAAQAALAYIASFTNLTFVQTTSASAQLRFGNADLTGVGGGVTNYSYNSSGLLFADVTIGNTNPDSAATNFTPGDLTNPDLGGQSWEILLHEIGHALGLKHPFDTNAAGDSNSVLPPALDNADNTVMSYTPFSPGVIAVVTGNSATFNYLQPQTYGLFDIAALQYLYGTNTSSAGGKTYSFAPTTPILETISDAGPNDTIDCSALTGPNRIDLTPGASSNLAIAQNLPAWAVPSNAYNGTNALTMGLATLVANAIGGSGNDIVIGNSASNRLNGGGGNDALYGQDGDDTLIGGAASGGTNQLWGGTGSDTASYAGTTGAVYADLGAQAGYVGGVLVDQMNSIENLTGGSGTNTLVGDGGANVLTGSIGIDYLYGQGGDDTLIGGAAPPGAINQLWGGAGSDTASYAGTTSIVYADLAAQAGYVGGVLVDQMNSVENLTGGSGTNTLVGDGGANVLTGGVGIDYLYGQGGDDTLIGGAAAAGATNQLWGGSGSDTASYAGTTANVYADLRVLNAYVGGVLTDQMDSIENLTGGAGNDVLVGDGGVNVLNGGAGADQLYGMGGADRFVYAGYADSNLATGYDTIADFVSGTDTLDLSALHTSAAHVAFASGGGSTNVYIEQNAGSFNAATDLAISFVGANAIAIGDVKF